MPARLSAFVIWAMLAASAAFWGLRLTAHAAAAPPYTVAVGGPGPMKADLARLFGAPATATAASPQQQAQPAIGSRFQLTGVMAPQVPGEQGVALIAVDGKMPRAYRVGALLDDDLALQSVSLRTATIGPAGGAAAVVLQMPPLPLAATGTLPEAVPTSSPAGARAARAGRDMRSPAYAVPSADGDGAVQSPQDDPVIQEQTVVPEESVVPDETRDQEAIRAR